MDERVRIRINVSEGELEVEGPERFVQSYADKLEDLFTLLKEGPTESTEPLHKEPNQRGGEPTNELPNTFGELFHQLPRNAKDVDKMLIACYFAQHNNPQNQFVTADASKLLTEQGVKLTNPSRAVKLNLEAKRIITVQRGKFRVSPEGTQYINQLLGSSTK